ncbi:MULTISPECIES: DUF3906 family protein [Aeribacillus]|uniref:DUF3906 domain-containing protein n=2 Tax=Bacillaceae TaxID=186817 RepID=A0A165X7V7_9BACI|nr:MULTISPECIES: DUF3906 family protein [Aeribacillus]REJ24085.1 MAG: DUF3906 domain-containing protein [Bacillaceae bacterium]ASS91616.1 hypothetical protein AP3564_16495 [Aeribacillus pallidus]KZM58035.1 hypothetical protein A3Q35_00740 [Aeribacillus pallidus]KZN95726.1 hypothetical protein AZI98_11655 [Aeribacillus pallidus]MDR9795443.1 DUF3906 family protein [Aeribacillus pallidus]
MYLYRFLVKTKEKEIPVIIAAENDLKAFEQVDVELEKFYLKVLDIEDVTLYEKKKIRKSAGFVIDESDVTLCT